MNSIFNQLLNVKNTVVEDACIVDSPLETPGLRLLAGRTGRRHAARGLPEVRRRGRPGAVGGARLEVHARLRGGVRVADDGRQPEDGRRFPHIAWRTAGDIAHRVAERLGTVMPSPFDGLTAIGVDETGYRKGHTYLTVVVDHERHRVIWAHDGYGKDVFSLFLKALTPGQRASIKVVTGDGARWIDSCVAEHRPNAERVLDGFHIVSWMSDALDKARKRLWNQARHDGDENAAKRMRGVRYAVLKNPGDLTDRQEEAFESLRDTDPKGQLYRAWRLRELLRTLLKHPIGQATTELNRRVFRASHSRIPEIVELAKKIRRRRPDILRTIRLGYSNARLEASDNRIKVTIRMAYGFHHVDNLIALVMLRCGGLDIRLPQPAI